MMMIVDTHFVSNRVTNEGHNLQSKSCATWQENLFSFTTRKWDSFLPSFPLVWFVKGLHHKAALPAEKGKNFNAYQISLAAIYLGSTLWKSIFPLINVPLKKVDWWIKKTWIRQKNCDCNEPIISLSFSNGICKSDCEVFTFHFLYFHLVKKV